MATGSSITEGIGQGRETANLVGAPIDVAYQISDTDALNHVFYLVEHEGLVLGGSSGINIEGAVRMARELGPGLQGSACSRLAGKADHSGNSV